MAIMTRANFTNFDLLDMLPMLDEIQFQLYERWAEQYSEIFKVMTSTKSFEQAANMGGLGEFSVIAENGPMQYDAGVQGYKENFLHSQYGLGYRFSRVMEMNQNFGILKNLEKDLSNSGLETVERVCARWWNGAFTTNLMDGVPLFSASHPSPRQGVGLRSNVLPVAADLDPISIQLLLTMARKATDMTGKKIQVKPRRLIVAPEGEFLASSFINSTDNPTTSNRDINVLHHRERLGPFRDFFVYDYQLDPDAWSIQMTDHQLRFYWRERPNTVNDVDFDTRGLKRAQWMQFSLGSAGWEGYYGCPGV
jgi:hypothetical protein